MKKTGRVSYPTGLHVLRSRSYLMRTIVNFITPDGV
jgi:hypothetical protein